VTHWIENINCNVYVYDTQLKIILISKYFKKWFRKNNISVTLCDKNILRTELCNDKSHWKRTIFAFDQEKAEITEEDIIFNNKSFRFEVTRKKIGNGDGIVVVTLKEI